MKHSYERIHNDITHIFSFTFTKKIYCYLSSSFYTWPRPTSSMKPPRLSWSNYGRGDLSRTGRKRKIGIPHYTHINHQSPSILKIKTCTKKQMNKLYSYNEQVHLYQNSKMHDFWIMSSDVTVRFYLIYSEITVML